MSYATECNPTKFSEVILNHLSTETRVKKDFSWYRSLKSFLIDFPFSRHQLNSIQFKFTCIKYQHLSLGWEVQCDSCCAERYNMTGRDGNTSSWLELIWHTMTGNFTWDLSTKDLNLTWAQALGPEANLYVISLCNFFWVRVHFWVRINFWVRITFWVRINFWAFWLLHAVLLINRWRCYKVIGCKST